MRWSIILLWSMLILASIFFVHKFASTEDQKIVEMERSAWIGLPKSSMDARSIEVRETLHLLMDERQNAPRHEPLALTCGENSSETYSTALMSNGGAQAYWQVEMQVMDERIQVTKWVNPKESPMSFLPQIPPDKMPSYAYDGRVVEYLPKTHLQSLANAWKAPSIWSGKHEMQLGLHCLTLIMEACVNGQYGARLVGCGHNLDGHQASIKLRSEIEELILERKK